MERWMRMMLGATLKECNVDWWSGHRHSSRCSGDVLHCLCNAYAMPLRVEKCQNSSAVLIWSEVRTSSEAEREKGRDELSL
jgi:hypothetical protein